MGNFSRRRYMLGATYRLPKSDKTVKDTEKALFILSMLFGGFFTYGITWAALIGYFMYTRNN